MCSKLLFDLPVIHAFIVVSPADKSKEEFGTIERHRMGPLCADSKWLRHSTFSFFHSLNEPSYEPVAMPSCSGGKTITELTQSSCINSSLVWGGNTAGTYSMSNVVSAEIFLANKCLWSDWRSNSPPIKKSNGRAGSGCEGL